MKIRFTTLFLAVLLTSCISVANRAETTSSEPVNTSTPQGSIKAQDESSEPAAVQMGGMSQKKPESDTIKIDSKEVNTNQLDELKSIVANASTNTSAQNPQYQKAIEIVESKLSPSDLDRIVRDSDFGFLRAHAALRLGELYLTADESSTAKKYFNTVIDLVPESDIAYRAKEIIAQMEASNRVQSHTVGAVLPLTGKSSAIGQRALRGLQMGLGLHLPGSGFKLAVVDSEGNPDVARRGVERLVREDNVIGIVGSLLSRTSTAVANKAQELKVPNIGLSQRNGLTDSGDYVFRNSFTSTMQVRALVRTAMETMDMKKFAILYPNDAYGVEFANVFWDEVLARGGQITAVQSYSTKETDFRLVIQRLVGTYFGEARQDEFKWRLAESKKLAGKKSIRNSNVENILPAVLDFDAIFIPDSVKAMGQISAMLSYSDIKKVKLLGTNLWNTRDLSKRAGYFANELLFVDSMSPETRKKSRFIAEYKSLYGEEPSIIEIQAYDTGLLLRQIIASGVSSRGGLSEKLKEVQNVPGAIGNLSINSYREIERPMIPLTVVKGEIVPL